MKEHLDISLNFIIKQAHTHSPSSLPPDMPLEKEKKRKKGNKVRYEGIKERSAGHFSAFKHSRKSTSGNSVCTPTYLKKKRVPSYVPAIRIKD